MTKFTKHIHVIDDDRVICHSISECLSRHGYDVSIFSSAEQYLESILNNDDYDGYLLLDHKMSGMSGLDLQKELIQKDIHPKIIFITAMGDLIEKQALANGAIKVFEKPFDLKELIEIL